LKVDKRKSDLLDKIHGPVHVAKGLEHPRLNSLHSVFLCPCLPSLYIFFVIYELTAYCMYHHGYSTTGKSLFFGGSFIHNAETCTSESFCNQEDFHAPNQALLAE
jgi:hypothetical protein